MRFLADRDEYLATVVKTYGQPPLWVREPGFPTLVFIILEQQVSLASARAAFTRLKAAVSPLTPKRFLKLTDDELLRIGFSRQKTRYTRLLAESLAHRYFDLRDLHELHDDSARNMLIAFKGIGRWTADIYLLSALRRPDIWPTGDLALATAVRHWLDPVLEETHPFLTYYLAIVFIAWACETGPTILAILLGSVAATYFFLTPRWNAAVHQLPAPLA